MKRILAILCVIACLCGLCVPAMAAGTITVSVKAPADWAEVCLYVWNDDGEMTTWPGDAMVKSADGLWTLAIPAGLYTNVIANNGSDAAKTADLKMDGTADCWIDAGAGVVYTDAGFSNPFGGNAGNGGNADGTVNLSGLNSLALVGTGIPGVSEWTPGDPAGDMTKNSNGIYTKVIAVTAGTTMQFKIAGNDAWDDAYNFGGSEAGINVALGTKVNLTNGGGSADLTLTAAKDGNLKFTVDLNEMTVLVEETDEEASVTPPAQGGEETGALGAEKAKAKREETERRREGGERQNDFADERTEAQRRVRRGAKVANEVKSANVKGFGAERHIGVNVVRRKNEGAGFENFASGLRVILDDVVFEKRLRRREKIKRRKNR